MSEEKPDTLGNKVKEAVMKVLPVSEVDLDDIKEWIWNDLSVLYYKYENEDQKRAFRDVMHEIAERINNGDWKSVYNKLYRLGQADKPF
jgi:hypothetical protein